MYCASKPGFSRQPGCVGDIQADAVAKGGVFQANIPFMVFFFHFVAFVFDADFLILAFLRFEAIFGLALSDLSFRRSFRAFVEGAGVGGLVAEVEGEHGGVGDLAGCGSRQVFWRVWARLASQWDSAMLLINMDSVSEVGECSAVREAFNASKPLGSSVERRTKAPL